MALFTIESPELKAKFLVRTTCISCVRQMVVEVAPSEEFDVWGDFHRAKVTHLPDGFPGVAANGARGVIKRIDNE